MLEYFKTVNWYEMELLLTGSQATYYLFQNAILSGVLTGMSVFVILLVLVVLLIFGIYRLKRRKPEFRKLKKDKKNRDKARVEQESKEQSMHLNTILLLCP